MAKNILYKNKWINIKNIRMSIQKIYILWDKKLISLKEIILI